MPTPATPAETAPLSPPATGPLFPEKDIAETRPGTAARIGNILWKVMIVTAGIALGLMIALLLFTLLGGAC
jgi:hypothetical protein